MPGGFGGGSWGGGAWGGSEGFPPSQALETVTLSEGLTINLPLFLTGITTLSPFLLEIFFSHDLDPGFAPNTDPSNFLIAPTLAVSAVLAGSGPKSKRLVTSAHGSSLYTLTVVTARSVPGDLLQPPNQTLPFAGFGFTPVFQAAAQTATKVMLVFSTGMVTDSNFTNPANYQVTDLNGTVVPVVSVVAQGPAPVIAATLTLGAPLSKSKPYVATVDSSIQTLTGLRLNPLTDVFQWVPNMGSIEIPFSSFSGEVSGGLLGQPAGQIFFSPALLTSVPNSIVQVEEASLCSRAYDSYQFPQPLDPPALFTFSPTAPAGTIGPDTILWAPAERLGLARVQLGDLRSDAIPIPTDGLTEMTLFEPIDITRGGFLNDARWHLYDGSPTTFSTYDNLTPAGPGPAEYLRAPYDLVEVLDNVATGSSIVIFLLDTVSVTDAVGLEKLVVLSDSVSMVDSGDVFLSGGWTGEFSPEFE